jgi:hypothetical protein
VFEERWAERLARREWDDDGRLINEVPFEDVGPGLCGNCARSVDVRTKAIDVYTSRSGEIVTTLAACKECLLQLTDAGYDVVHPRRWPDVLPARDAAEFMPEDLPVHVVGRGFYGDRDTWEPQGR